MTYQLSPTTREVLRRLEEKERQRTRSEEAAREFNRTMRLPRPRWSVFDREEPAT